MEIHCFGIKEVNTITVFYGSYISHFDLMSAHV